MHYSNIKPIDIADGIGVRVGIWVSGCSRNPHCKGCFNPEAWDFNAGKDFSQEVIDDIFSMVDKKFIWGITIMGGEPMEPKHQGPILDFLMKFRERFGDTKTVWVYSGFTLDELMTEYSYCHTAVTEELLSYIDILVDGMFVESLKNPALRFRGSSNQRIIDMKATIKEKKIVLAPFEDRTYTKFE